MKNKVNTMIILNAFLYSSFAFAYDSEAEKNVRRLEANARIQGGCSVQAKGIMGRLYRTHNDEYVAPVTIDQVFEMCVKLNMPSRIETEKALGLK